MATRRRVLGIGDSEKLDAARIPKITDALTASYCGHLSCFLAEYQLYRHGFYYACLVYSIAVALSLGVGTLAEKIYH